MLAQTQTAQSGTSFLPEHLGCTGAGSTGGSAPGDDTGLWEKEVLALALKPTQRTRERS